jgi:monomeric sarcosine oxidase
MGLATAYHIRKKSDKQVLVVDKYGIGNEYCSSNDANRVFRYSYGNDELYTRMAVESLRLWKQLEQESGTLLLQTGLLLLKGEDEAANGFNEASYETLSKTELGASRLDKNELAKRYPQFRAEEAFFDPHGGVLLASKAINALKTLSESHGAKFLHATARRTHPEGILQISSEDQRTIEFQKLVMTVGPWTNTLLGPGRIQITPTRQQIIYFRPPNGVDGFRPEMCPVFFTDKHYGLPAAGIDAVKLSPKELTEPVDPETARRTVDEEQISDCRNACKKFVPEIADGRVFSTKVCLYDMTENSDFVLDEDPDRPDLVYGYGFSGHGFKFAPLIGKLLAELSLDEDSSFKTDRFSAVLSKRKLPTLGAHLGKSKE